MWWAFVVSSRTRSMRSSSWTCAPEETCSISLLNSIPRVAPNNWWHMWCSNSWVLFDHATRLESCTGMSSLKTSCSVKVTQVSHASSSLILGCPKSPMVMRRWLQLPALRATWHLKCSKNVMVVKLIYGVRDASCTCSLRAISLSVLKGSISAPSSHVWNNFVRIKHLRRSCELLKHANQSQKMEGTCFLKC